MHIVIMSAHDHMKLMLDQLMGTTRNGDKEGRKIKFYDQNVCKCFLLGFCPYDILSNTRIGIGRCPKIHDYALRADFAEASQHRDYFYDIEAMGQLQAFITDCDRRILTAKRRLINVQVEVSNENAAKINKVATLTKQIGEKLAQAEQLGAEGSIQESLKIIEEINELKKEKQKTQEENRKTLPASCYQHQKLHVCEVCSVYLGLDDDDGRLADHFGGKLHQGYIQIRQKLIELQQTMHIRMEQRRDMEQYEAKKSSLCSESGNSDSSRSDHSSNDRDKSDYDHDEDYHKHERDRSKERRDSRRDKHRHKRKRSHKSRSKSYSKRSSRRSRRSHSSSREHKR